MTEVSPTDSEWGSAPNPAGDIVPRTHYNKWKQTLTNEVGVCFFREMSPFKAQ